jgi:uncharacterized protein
MSMRDFEISIVHLRQRGTGVERFGFVSTMGGLEVTSSRIASAEPIEVSGQIEAVGEGMLVSLAVRTRWHGECVRCLAPTEGPLELRTRELFREGPTTDDTYGFTGEVLDLSELVHDVLVLELPVLPLCRDDCRGLCPICGADRNEGACGCESAKATSPFDVLDGLERSRGDATHLR